MAAVQGDATLHSDGQNDVQIQFIDEEDFLWLIVPSNREHQASDHEFYSDESELSSEDSSEEEICANDVGFGEEEWSREVKRRVDIDFSEET